MFDQLYAEEAPANAVATTKPTEVALEDIDLQKIALAHFDASNVALQTAREKLTDVVHDLSTATKLAEAKSLRERLINAPLAEARKVNKGLKAKLTAVSKAVGARLESIEAGFADVEKLITPQIEERDAQIAAEKAEREAREAAEKAAREHIEAVRVGVHRDNIAKIAGYVQQLQGKTHAQLCAAIGVIEAIVIDRPAWEEFADAAFEEKARVLKAVRDLREKAKAAEDEAAAREAQRVENERIAAALAEERRQIEADRAELKRQADELASKLKAEADRIAAAAQAQRDAEAKAVADAEAAQRQAAEDEANRLAQEAAAEALQRAIDATPADVVADAYAPEPPVIADEPMHTMVAVSPGILHPTPEALHIDDVAAKSWALPAGPVTFADDEPEAPASLAALLAHIDEAFTGKFAAHPKPPREWWGALRRLSDEAREHVAA